MANEVDALLTLYSLDPDLGLQTLSVALLGLSGNAEPMPQLVKAYKDLLRCFVDGVRSRA